MKSESESPAVTIAIIGSGPTAIYTLHHLLESPIPLRITLFEQQAEAGKGTPYHQDWNHESMLANIASIEIPALEDSLLEWLESHSDMELARMGISPEELDERAFFPRVVLGEYFHAQCHKLLQTAEALDHNITLATSTHVLDVAIEGGEFLVTSRKGDNIHEQSFSRVVLATGHAWPKQTEQSPGYFTSPWPASSLSTIGNHAVGIRGTSLSAIDAAVALSVARGAFWRDGDGTLHYYAEPGTEGFSLTMMSRKGILPEADFYHPIPYEPLSICTDDAVDALCRESSGEDLLDRIFVLFKQELALADPAYAQTIALDRLGIEDFCDAYFAERASHDPFAWAAANLAEAQANQRTETTVPWRYAILRMHEVIARAVPHFNAEDHLRFNRHFKPVFVDDYATVPHESIERLLALHRAGKLEVLRLGGDYDLQVQPDQRGATLTMNDEERHFPAFIEAMGQRELKPRDFPFPSLWSQGVIRSATAPWADGERSTPLKIGGVALDKAFHPRCDRPEAMRLYCVSLPFLLGQFPFAQGITSSHDMGKTVAQDLLSHLPEKAHASSPPKETMREAIRDLHWG